MSANLIVDINGTAKSAVSVAPAAGVGSTPASGVIVGTVVDLQYQDTFTNVFLGGTGNSTSGSFRGLVQTSPDTTSGNFTDPTSGLAQLPTNLQSGGILIANSGTLGSNGFISGFGGIQYGAFQRPAGHRYARLIVMSGDRYNGTAFGGFTAQHRTTGSGGGFTFALGS
jgi:hypothetical protein